VVSAATDVLLMQNKKVVDARIRTHAGMNYIIREHYHPTPTNNRLYTVRYELG
jgi:hypothetical protein